MRAIREFLELRSSRGPWIFGELSIDGLTIRHFRDAMVPNLRVYIRPQDARELVKFDESGQYRPLKTAPNLRRGWLLSLASLGELRLALDFIYPAALGTWLAFSRGELEGVPLRRTLDRQTGMYRLARLVTDEQAEAAIDEVCRQGCLRRRLWSVHGHQEGRPDDSHLCILCAEACGILITACRAEAKKNLPPQ
ncbi:MAG TPA: DR2241 family protein [Chthoniobacterales bacterium]